MTTPDTSQRNSGAALTGGVAVVAGIGLLLGPIKDPVPSNEAWFVIGAGVLAIVVTALAAWDSDKLKGLVGPEGILSSFAAPLGWLAAALASVVVATHMLPVFTPWSSQQVFAVALVVLLLLAVLGWGPRMTGGAFGGIHLSTLTVLGSLVAVALVVAYLFFLDGLRGAAVNTGTTDAQWARLVEIRATLEALAFAAAGALLGTTIQSKATIDQTVRADDGEEAIAGALEKLPPAPPSGDGGLPGVATASFSGDQSARVEAARSILEAGLKKSRRR